MGRQKPDRPGSIVAFEYRRATSLRRSIRRRSRVTASLSVSRGGPTVSTGARSRRIQTVSIATVAASQTKAITSQNSRTTSMCDTAALAGAYAACFLGALQNAAEMSHRKKIEGATVLGRAHLEEDARGGWQLNVDLRATLPGVNGSDTSTIPFDG